MGLLETHFCGSLLNTPLVNGAGTVKTIEQFEKLAETGHFGAITVGGITYEERGGNSGKTFHYFNEGAVNSLGLPNGGVAYYGSALKRMAEIALRHGVEIVLNLSGFTPEANAELAKLGIRCGVKFLEINTGCPNALAEGKRKPVIGFDVPMCENHICAVQDTIGNSGVKVGVKSTHYSNPFDRDRFAILCRDYGIDFITACNTLPDCFVCDTDGDPVITPNDGYAGGSGRMVKASAMAHVRRYRELCPGMDIIGMGGIETGDDLAQYQRVGATLGGTATELYRTDNDPGVGYRILDRFMTIEEVRRNPIISVQQ